MFSNIILAFFFFSKKMHKMGNWKQKLHFIIILINLLLEWGWGGEKGTRKGEGEGEKLLNFHLIFFKPERSWVIQAS